MAVFIANFGQGNYLWPTCLTRNTIATVDNERVHRFWQERDRPGFVDYATQHLRTARGELPTRSVASRWYSINDEVAETVDDLWIHRERDQLWWTISRSGPLETKLQASKFPERDGPSIYELHKPCADWSNQNGRGALLIWDALPVKAKDFLFTEGTLQRLSAENALYAQALVAGEDLNFWHSNPVWLQRQQQAKKSPGTTFDFRKKTIYRLVDTAFYTAASANGQQSTRTVKNKYCDFETVDTMMAYVTTLVKDQDGLCAITGIKLQLDGEVDDDALRYSLDRIDSSGHYERGNLQVVCKFVNRWKGDSVDAEFRRLIEMVRTNRF